MSRVLVLAGLASMAGVALILSDLRWFRRPSLADRLRPYVAGGGGSSHRSGVFSVTSMRDVVAPLSSELGERLARIVGVAEDLETRLRRIHADVRATEFRVRQVAWSALALVTGSFVAAALSLPIPLLALAVIGSPLLAFLLVEQRLAHTSAHWQRRVFLELPVVAEQLGMLLSSGYSLGAALGRLAERGSGACSADLARVMRRTRQGLSDVEALREWAELVDVDAVTRLVGVLALNHEAGNLGRLIAEEARTVRRDVQRELIESIERRNQQVWIPVTVAALVPGVLLMAVPFVDALSLFSGTP